MQLVSVKGCVLVFLSYAPAEQLLAALRLGFVVSPDFGGFLLRWKSSILPELPVLLSLRRPGITWITTCLRKVSRYLQRRKILPTFTAGFPFILSTGVLSSPLGGFPRFGCSAILFPEGSIYLEYWCRHGVAWENFCRVTFVHPLSFYRILKTARFAGLIIVLVLFCFCYICQLPFSTLHLLVSNGL